MKIGIILPGFSSNEGDWCIPALLNLVRCVSSQTGIELHVFPLRYPHSRRPYSVYQVVVHPQGGAAIRGATRLSLLTRSVASILREHRRSRFDVLHSYWADEPGLVATTAARLLRIPAIVSLAGGELARISEIGYGGQLNSTNRMMTRIVLRSAHQVTAGSRYLARIAKAHGGQQAMLLPFGVDTVRFSPSDPDEDGKPLYPLSSDGAVHILNVASLVPVKDQVALINAMKPVVRLVPTAHLHLVGEGPMRSALQEHASQLGLTAQVHLHGEVTHDQLPALYRSADFCVLSSRYEAQGMVILEAAACGRVTVGTDVGILSEVSPASAVRVGDTASLSRQMIATACDPILRSQRGNDALLRVRRDFTLEATTLRLFDLYRGAFVRKPRLNDASF